MRTSKKVKCEICGKVVFARGLKSHIRLLHELKIENVTQVTEKVKLIGITQVDTSKELQVVKHYCLNCGKERDNDVWATCNECHSKPVTFTESEFIQANKKFAADYLSKQKRAD